MGANDKAEATYHGGEYTPDTEQVRDRYGWSGHDSYLLSVREGKKAEFDRWLEGVRAEAWDRAASCAPEYMPTNPYRNQPSN